jgi:hypothetical protein
MTSAAHFAHSVRAAYFFGDFLGLTRPFIIDLLDCSCKID